MLLYIIRHGDPDYENDTLTAKGHREAKLLAERLSKCGLTHIFSSPLGRAKDTMGYTAAETSIEPVIEEWTRELSFLKFDTPYGRLAAWDVPAEVYLQELNDTFDKEKYDGYFPDMNMPDRAFQKVAEASDKFFSHFNYVKEGSLYRIEKPSKARVAVFCHGGFGLTWLAYLLNIPYRVMWSGFWLPPTSVSTIVFEERSDIWAVPRCISLADTSHLVKGEEPLSYSGLKANKG